MRTPALLPCLVMAALLAATSEPSHPQQLETVTSEQPQIEEMSVQKLEQVLSAAHGKSDKDLARQLAGIQLNERLSASRFGRLQAAMPGGRSGQALLAVADASAFLEPPRADYLSDPVPDRASEGEILTRAAGFVAQTMAKMPDFFATRTTTRFDDLKIRYIGTIPETVTGEDLQLRDRKKATVTYRDGREVEETGRDGRLSESKSQARGLNNWGVFGPLLGVVMADILKSKVVFGHWEQGVAGPTAVFYFVVPKDKASYTVKYCCYAVDKGVMRDFETVPTYHGEIAIDPKTGNVLRLEFMTELPAGLPIFAANVMVEYGPVELGGKTYICPLRSVSSARTTLIVFKNFLLNEDQMLGELANGPQVTAVNDVAFSNYHVFRAPMRILPAESGNAAPPR